MASDNVTSRFVLAKYVPDLDRMEPRNIGVILWSNGKLCARFLSEDKAAPIVEEIDTYRRWVEFWSEMTIGESIEPRRGKSVPTSSSTCVDALLSNQEGNFILVDTGEVMQQLRGREVSKATDFLFGELVATRTLRDPRVDRKKFDVQCVEVLLASGIAQRPNFKHKFSVPCLVNGVPIPVHFSYGLGLDAPEALMQRAHLASEESITSSYMKIQSVFQLGMLTRDRCVALYRKSDIASPTAEKGHELLSKLCDVVDIESADAKDRLAAIAPAPSTSA